MERDALLIGPGRNENNYELYGGIPTLRKVFRGSDDDILRRYRNSLRWDQNLKHCLVRSPQIIRSDWSKKTIWYQWIDKKTSLQEMLFHEDAAQLLPYMQDVVDFLGVIHSRTVGADSVVSVPTSPLFRVCHFLTKDEYAISSGGELEFYAFLQHDSDLVRAMDQWNSAVNGLKHSMIHGDFRLDQILVDAEGRAWVIDFEEYGYGLALKDFAGLIGSLIFAALLQSFSTAPRNADSIDAVNEAFIEQERNNFAIVLPLILQAVKCYSQVEGMFDWSNLSVLTGVFVLERIMSRAKLSYKMSEVDKAIMGVARSFIVDSQALKQVVDDAL